MYRVFFTRDGSLVHIQSNPHYSGEVEESLDFCIGPEEKFMGIAYSVLWDAGAGEIQITPDETGKIIRISQDQNDKIFSWSSVSDTPLWYHCFDNDPCVMMPFYKDYGTSLKKYFSGFK